MTGDFQAPTGHVFRVSRRRGDQWYAKFRLPDGRQVQRRLGPAWTERGRPPVGYFTKRRAEDWLRGTLDEARRGTLPGMVRTGATFADACAEYLRYIAQDRGRKASTVEDYRSIINVHLLPTFGELQLEEITVPAVEAFQASLARRVHRGRAITPRTRNKVLNVLHGVFARARKVWGLATNPAAGIERHPQRNSGDIEVFSPEEVWALIRHADDERDAAVYATAAFTGLRMGELRALRWRDVDFPRSVIRVRASYAAGELSVPKSGKVRSVPMVDEAAQLLAQLNRRADFTNDDDLVFCEIDGGWLNDDRLRRRYETAMKRAGLRRLRFHDLRHTFGSLAITRADIVEVQAWMGHADIQTTMRYLHYRDRGQAAERLADAFHVKSPDETTASK
ncbi:MAG TPA: site-specific integrase [Solirubrobacteraceae bacterium]|jgi:integrase|nr:site-specific integrase [Solirubrobacteraceae bacterium]